MNTIYPHNNPDGLQVRDLIAELQRHHPNDYTDVASVGRVGGSMRLRLRELREFEEDRINSSISIARSVLKDTEQQLANAKAELARVTSRTDAARKSLRHIKQLHRTRIKLP